MVVLLIIGVLNLVHIFDLIAYTRDNKPNEEFELKDFSSFWVTALGSVILYAVEYSYKLMTAEFWLRVARKQHDPVLRQKYGKKALKCTFQVMWYIFIIGYGYNVIRDGPIDHYWMGGKAMDTSGLWADLPFQNDEGMFTYMLISHSYHFLHLIEVLFLNERANDFE